MSEKIVRLSPNFTIADAECPDLSLINGNTLRVRFLDYCESLVEIEFSEIVGFKWSIDELDYPKISDDSVYEIKNSVWIEQYRQLGEPVSTHKHYKLCFNVCGVLDVIFNEMKVIASPEI